MKRWERTFGHLVGFILPVQTTWMEGTNATESVADSGLAGSETGAQDDGRRIPSSERRRARVDPDRPRRGGHGLPLGRHSGGRTLSSDVVLWAEEGELADTRAGAVDFPVVARPSPWAEPPKVHPLHLLTMPRRQEGDRTHNAPVLRKIWIETGREMGGEERRGELMSFGRRPPHRPPNPRPCRVRT
jgi:hypothetical protein